MKKLSKDAIAMIEDAKAAVLDARAKLIERFGDFVNEAQVALDEIDTLEQAYSEALERLQDTLTDASGDITDYMDGRSEKWRKSDKAEAHQEWADSLIDWMQPDLPDIKQTIIDALDINIDEPAFDEIKTELEAERWI